jgi:hypothetical protein
VLLKKVQQPVAPTDDDSADEKKKKEEEEEEAEEEEKKNNNDPEWLDNYCGCVQPHSSTPELWNVDGTEVDWHAKYKVGTQLWYLQSRALERYNATPRLPIAAIPLNDAAQASERPYMTQVEVVSLEKEGEEEGEESAHSLAEKSMCAKFCERLGCCVSTTTNFHLSKKSRCTKWEENSPKYLKFKNQVRDIVTADWYQWAMIGLIMLNTTLLAVDHYPMSFELEQALNDWGWPFTIIFTIEVFVKIWSMGVQDWKQGSFNQFDAVVVFLDWVGAFLIAITGDGGKNSALSSITVLRTLRLLRVFKLVDFWEEFRKSIQTIMRSIEDVLNFTVVLMLVIFVAALLGMGIFGGRYTESGFEEVPRGNFNSMSWALITVFQVITGENWNEVMMVHMEVDLILSVIFFVLVYSFGQYILLNIFLVILLENQGTVENEEEEEEEKEEGEEEEEEEEEEKVKVKEKEIDVVSPSLQTSNSREEVTTKRKLLVLFDGQPKTTSYTLKMNETSVVESDAIVVLAASTNNTSSDHQRWEAHEAAPFNNVDSSDDEHNETCEMNLLVV